MSPGRPLLDRVGTSVATLLRGHPPADEQTAATFDREGRSRCRRGARTLCLLAVALITASAILNTVSPRGALFPAPADSPRSPPRPRLHSLAAPDLIRSPSSTRARPPGSGRHHGHHRDARFLYGWASKHPAVSLEFRDSRSRRVRDLQACVVSRGRPDRRRPPRGGDDGDGALHGEPGCPSESRLSRGEQRHCPRDRGDTRASAMAGSLSASITRFRPARSDRARAAVPLTRRNRRQCDPPAGARPPSSGVQPRTGACPGPTTTGHPRPGRLRVVHSRGGLGEGCCGGRESTRWRIHQGIGKPDSDG